MFPKVSQNQLQQINRVRLQIREQTVAPPEAEPDPRATLYNLPEDTWTGRSPGLTEPRKTLTDQILHRLLGHPETILKKTWTLELINTGSRVTGS